MKKNKILINMVKKYKGKEVLFRDLPNTAQLAMAWYMSLDGEAWNIDPSLDNCSMKVVENKFISTLQFYIKRYGKMKFGFVNLPIDDLINQVFPDDLKSQYVRGLPEKVRSEIWPVILDLSYDPMFYFGPLQDGWHRFGDYFDMGLKNVPCLYYLDSQKYY